MARKNPEHFRAEFEFHEGLVFISCSCGQFFRDEDIEGAFHLLKRHHAKVVSQSGTAAIYKED